MWQRIVQWVPGTAAFARRRAAAEKLALLAAARPARTSVAEQDAVLAWIFAGGDAAHAPAGVPGDDEAGATPPPGGEVVRAVDAVEAADAIDTAGTAGTIDTADTVHSVGTVEHSVGTVDAIGTVNGVGLVDTTTGIADTVGFADTVAEWARTMSANSYLAMTSDELEDELTRFADALAREVSGRGPGEWPAQRIGRELALRLRLTPQSFQDVLELIIPWLETRRGATAGRRSKVIAALAGGFADGARDRVLDEQLRITSAAWAAARRPPLPPPGARLDEAVLDRSPQPGCALAADGTVTHANPALCALLGRPADALVGTHLGDHVVAEGDRAALAAALAEASTGEEPAAGVELALVGAAGAPVARVSAAVEWRADGPAGRFLVLLHDTTVLRAWQRALLPGNDHDEVTMLPDQRNFLHRVQSHLDDARPGTTIGLCALRFRDLNTITRALGPGVRNKVVTTLAARVVAAVAEMPATTVGRLDRDTFGVLLTDPHSWHGVTGTLRRLVDWLSEPMCIDGQELALAPAVGVAEARGDTDAVELLARAGFSLHVGGDRGTPWQAVLPRRAHGDPDEDRVRLLAALPRALEDGEITIAYTPIVRLRDGVVVGAEASAQWHHPDGRVRPADDLVALADEIGLTLPWVPWMLRTVVRQAARWRKALGKAAPRVTVNVPRRFARNGDLVVHVRAALEEAVLPASQLMLSMPESAVVDEHGDPRSHLLDLGGLSVPLALDGLGTEFSRYDTLPKLTLQTVVIPPQLTASLDGSSQEQCRQAVAANLIRIGNELTHEVTVKGITTAAQRDNARRLSAKLGQGLFFGGPLAPQKIQDLLGGVIAV
ncbi:EAL domain-containing protein [Saccharothrix australiensis]|uniref:EAL domain-containing protein (Putative c-di-GMP-specific phosphodiesterase class I) n=1 Tax=Saccharothrix australiensis TaxID=2072 RepID=A0A495W3V0_9PSEU|nr:EAL domain-containing protein [Saccharothrix australiensis]RKT55770.1 EAL domain-containing protein (putative c-di-GMP-specific phosphodiesterase class I) [Saccharothrix australiensis]